MPVGGIKEKMIAAHRAGIETVLLPKRNEHDLKDVPQEVQNSLRFIFADTVEEILTQILDITAADWHSAPQTHPRSSSAFPDTPH